MIKRAETNDLEILAKLAVMMWQNHSVNELINEFSEIMANGKSKFFLKYENDSATSSYCGYLLRR